MKFKTSVIQCAVLIAFVAGSANIHAAAQLKRIPDTIITLQGKSFPSARLVRAEPDGITVEYQPRTGAVGLAKLKFRDLPENIRKEFNYNEQAASEFEQSRANALAEWRNALSTKQANQQELPSGKVANTASGDDQSFPVGRFRAEGTIRGAMIIDTITGEAWMADLHSTLGYYDYSDFLSPKVSLPAQPEPQVVIIGP